MGKVTGKAKQNQASRTQILSLLERQQYKCALSGAALTPDDAELDHIIPIANGGDNAIENIQIVTKQINRMKGSMDNEQFVEMCKRVAWAAPGALGPS